MLAIVPLLIAAASAADVAVNWNVGYVNVNPDGLQERRAISVNGLPTPPPLNVTLGDTLVLNVQNNLDESTSVHFHGLFQNGTNYYDGPVSVNQCGIPPGSNFTYRVPIQQHGTYWAHSHKGSQYVDGFRTPFILHNPVEQYTYDEEIVVTLADWYHTESPILLAKFLSQYNPTGAEPVPQSALINFSSNSTFNFTPGKTYRVRVINMSAFSMYYFYIDGHQMDIIELDGVDMQRKTVDQVSLSAAQRVSLLITAKNSTSNNYIMHADMEPDMFDTVPDDLNLNITATVIYDESAPVFNATPIAEHQLLDDTQLSPVQVIPAAPADISMTLDVNFDVLSDGTNHAMFNSIAWRPPIVPSIFTAMSMGDNANNSAVYGPQTHAYVLQHGDMVELVVNNNDKGDHPFHLHGHQFQIVYKNDTSAFDQSLSSSFDTLSNPVRRDTVTIAGGGSAVLRWRADNPGVWMFHCHIEWHLEAGLAVVFIEAPLEMQMTLSIPDEMYQQCAAQNIKTTGNVVGLNSTTDFSGAPYGPFPLPNRITSKGIGALAACVIAAFLGMGSVIWYALDDPLKNKNRNKSKMGGSTVVATVSEDINKEDK